MTRSQVSGVVCVALAAALLSVRDAAADLTGYEDLANWSALSQLNSSGTAGLASSYNRGADPQSVNDYGNFDSNGPPAVIRELTGPGVLTRIWMPHYTASVPAPQVLKIFIDGQSTPVIDTTSDKFFSDQSISMGGFSDGPRFRSPLLQIANGGVVSYEPITFQNSVRIETAPGHDYFYQVGYHQLPAGTMVQPYTPPTMANPSGLTPEQATQRQTVVQMLTNVGSNPAGAGTPTPVAGTTIAAGGSALLATLTGSGQVRGLTLHLSNSGAVPSDNDLNGLRLRVRYDGNTGNAIDIPVSQFFGAGNGRNPYKSLPLGVIKNQSDNSYDLYSYWPMPYRSGARIELYNDSANSGGARNITFDSASVDAQAGAVAANAGYLKAVYKTQTFAAGAGGRFNQLHVDGAGRYVGNLLSLRSGDASALEGDDIVTADGVLLHGTGLEDAYNGGYYYNTLGPPYQLDENDENGNPRTPTQTYSGLLSGPVAANTDQYRWLIGDSVSFANGIDVDMENVGSQQNTWGSTVFYYEVPEPGSAAALAVGAALVLVRRRRRPSR